MTRTVNKLGVTRMFRAAIIHAMDFHANDPATCAAIDSLTEQYISPQHMLDLLWTDPRSLEFGCMYALGIEMDPKKQSAVLLLTGRSWSDWMHFYDAATEAA